MTRPIDAHCVVLCNVCESTDKLSSDQWGQLHMYGTQGSLPVSEQLKVMGCALSVECSPLDTFRHNLNQYGRNRMGKQHDCHTDPDWKARESRLES